MARAIPLTRPLSIPTRPAQAPEPKHGRLGAPSGPSLYAIFSPVTHDGNPCVDSGGAALYDNPALLQLTCHLDKLRIEASGGSGALATPTRVTT